MRQAGVLPGLESGVEILQGDVYQMMTLPAAIGDRLGKIPERYST